MVAYVKNREDKPQKGPFVEVVDIIKESFKHRYYFQKPLQLILIVNKSSIFGISFNTDDVNRQLTLI